MFLPLTSLDLSYCGVDASGCPAIRTLKTLWVWETKVLLAGAGHPFPLISQDAVSLESLWMNKCRLIDVAGTGHLHIGAPRLRSMNLCDIAFVTDSKTCSLEGPEGLPPSLLSAELESSTAHETDKPRYLAAALYFGNCWWLGRCKRINQMTLSSVPTLSA